MHHKKAKYRVVIMVVLAMLFQIVGPTAQGIYALAMDKGNFSIVDERLEQGTAYMDWEFILDSSAKVKEFNYNAEFALKNAVEKDLIADDGTVIGEYKISTDGKLTVSIHQKLYKDLEEQQKIEGNKIPKVEEVETPKIEEGEQLETPEETEQPEGETSVQPGKNEEETPTKEEKNEIPNEETGGGDKTEEEVTNGEEVKETEKEDGNEVEDETDISGKEEDIDNETVEIDEEIEVIDDDIKDGEQGEKQNGTEVKKEEETGTKTGDKKDDEQDDITEGAYRLNNLRPYIAFASETEGNEVKTFKGTIKAKGARGKKGLIDKVVGLFGGRSTELGDKFKVTKATVKVNDIDISDHTKIKLGADDKIEVEYHWTIEDGIIEVGSTATIEIPEAFKIATEMQGTLSFKEIEFASYKISDGIIVITFDGKDLEAFNKESGRGGEVRANLKFNTNYFNKDVVQKVKFHESLNKEYTAILKPSGGSAISKTGKANRPKNATEIDWVIDVNTSLDDIKDMVINDNLPEAANEITDIKVYELKIGYNSDPEISGEPINGKDGNVINGFPINLGDTDKAYRILYTTKITDTTAIKFTNIASLNNGTPVVAKAETTIGELIENKVGTANSSQNAKTINWSFDVNTREADIDGAVVTDELEAGLKLVANSVKVYKLNIDTNPNQKGNEVTNSSDVSIVKNDGSFNITFNNSYNDGKGQPYRVEYQTEIDYTKVDEGDSHPFASKTEPWSHTFKNQASIKLNESSDLVKSNNAEVPVTRDTLIEKTGTQDTKPGQKKINWTIEVNNS